MGKRSVFMEAGPVFILLIAVALAFIVYYGQSFLFAHICELKNIATTKFFDYIIFITVLTFYIVALAVFGFIWLTLVYKKLKTLEEKLTKLLESKVKASEEE